VQGIRAIVAAGDLDSLTKRVVREALQAKFPKVRARQAPSSGAGALQRSPSIGRGLGRGGALTCAAVSVQVDLFERKTVVEAEIVAAVTARVEAAAAQA